MGVLHAPYSHSILLIKLNVTSTIGTRRRTPYTRVWYIVLFCISTRFLETDWILVQIELADPPWRILAVRIQRENVICM